MQPVSEERIEALETQLRGCLPGPLKGEAPNMAAILLRALGRALGDAPNGLPTGADGDPLRHLRIALLTGLGAQDPGTDKSLDAAIGAELGKYRANARNLDRDAPEFYRAAALVLLKTVSGHGISFHYKDLGEVLLASGRPEMGIHWLEYARRLQGRSFLTQPPEQRHPRAIYSLFLRSEAQGHAALGNFKQAIDLRLKAHALDADDPDYTLVQTWSGEASVNEPVHDLSIGGFERLPALILNVSSILIKTSQERGRAVFKLEEPALELPDTQVVGTIGQGFGKNIGAIDFSVGRFENVRIYSDYGKTAVIDEAGRLVRSVSSGPAELALLADQCGFSPGYADLPGVTAVVTFNHNWFEYYHWLIEITHRVGLLIESGAAFDNLIAPGAFARRYCQEFLSLTGLDSKNVLGGSEPIAVRAADALIPGRTTSTISGFGIDFLRRLYLGRVPTRADAKRRLMISRQKAQHRKVTNYEQVHDLLSGLGFETVTFEDMDVRTQAKIMSEAEIVVAPHGAGLSNVVFCSPGATVIEFFSAGCPGVFQILSQRCELNYVALQVERSGWDQVVDIDLLRTALRSVGIL